jgi:hypothetical protein
MGRTGIEPVTLGLKVRSERLELVATDGNLLQEPRFAQATRCNERCVSETSPYSHPYSR